MADLTEAQETRIRAITRIYYSKPAVQQALLEFAKQREVVPRYFEGFGKRPDTILYPNDIMNLVNKGATSFHSSEEIWSDPLLLKTEMKPQEMKDLRSGWDLLIDIDSPYLDYSKIAATLVVDVLEKYGVKNYGIKYSGSKGFHIVVPSVAFPSVFNGQSSIEMFPDWPRAITEFLMHEIKPSYNKRIMDLGVNFAALEKKTKLSKEDLLEISCPNCGNTAQKKIMLILECPICKSHMERMQLSAKKKLRCIEPTCSGFYETLEEKEFYKCDSCGFSSYNKSHASSQKVVYSKDMRKSEEKYSHEFKEELAAEKLGSLDLVLVSPRHLFRMPYSLHEKTSLASVVLTKSQLLSFTPKDADPMSVSVIPYYPKAAEGEASHLLNTALEWKKQNLEYLEKQSSNTEKKYEYAYSDIELKGVTEDMFPAPIKKLLKGLVEGRKRGLFILITFFRAVGMPPEFIIAKVNEWNKKNEIPLKEGYVKSQLDWHLRQGKKIMPPNYSNASFYKDLGLIDKVPDVKNPVVEVARKLRKQQQ